MTRKNISTQWDRDNRNAINDNFKKLFDEFGNVVEVVSEKAYGEVIDAAKLNWLDPVDDFDSLPSGEEGDTRMARDTGIVYRNNGAEWREIQQIDAGPVNEVDQRLTSQLAQTVKKGETGALDLNVFDEDTRNILQGQEPGHINAVLGEKNVKEINLADNAVTPDKTTFMNKTKNLFDGVYHPITMRRGGNPTEGYYIRWTTVDIGVNPKTAIIPLEPNETYTVKLHDTNNEFLKIAILNEYPPSGQAFTIADTSVSWDDTLTEYTFTNTETGKYAIINVSETGIEPRMQVEKGSVATNYVFSKALNKEYLPPIDAENLSPNVETWVRKVQSDERFKELNKNLPRIQNIYPSQDFTPTATALAGISDDYSNYRVGNKGLKVNVISDNSYQIRFTLKNPPMQVKPTSTIGMWVYIDDASSIKSMALQVARNSDLSEFSVFTAESTVKTLRNGWNLLRWQVFRNTLPFNRKTIYEIRLSGSSSGETTFTVGHIWFEQPPKAQVLFIHDGGYPEFLVEGYPDLKRIGIPCTWAIRPLNVGDEGNHITESEILGLSNENHNEINFHSYQGVPTADMDEQELIDDCTNSIMYLRQRMYSKVFWRAAWMQNRAPYAESTRPLFYCYPQSEGGGGFMSSFPFTDNLSTMWDVKRFSLQGYNDNPELLDERFGFLKETHSLMVIYTHKVNEGHAADVTPERWNHFIQLCEQGINEGWLEGVTMNMLMERAGITGEERPANGDWITPLYEDYPYYGSHKLKSLIGN